MSSKFSRWLRSKTGTQTILGIAGLLLVVIILGTVLGWWAELIDLLSGTVVSPTFEYPRMVNCRDAYENPCGSKEVTEFSSEEDVCIAWRAINVGLESSSPFDIYVYNGRNELIFSYKEVESDVNQGRHCEVLPVEVPLEPGNYVTKFVIRARASYGEPEEVAWSLVETSTVGDSLSSDADLPQETTLPTSPVSDDVESPLERESLITLEGHEGPVVGVAFSPDGHWLAAGEYGSVLLWNTTDFTSGPVTSFKPGGDIESLAFSPDGRWLIIGDGADSTIKLWEVAYPTVNPVISHAHSKKIQLTAMSPDNRWVAVVDEGNAVWLWDLVNVTGELKPLLKEHEDNILAVSFNPDGRWLCVLSEKDVILWDMPIQENQPAIRSGHDVPIRVAAFTINKRWLSTIDEDGGVRLWNTSDPSAASGVLRGHVDGQIELVALSAEGRWLAAKSGETLQLWDLNDIQSGPVILSGHDGAILSLAFSPGSRWLAAGSGDGVVQIWHVQPD